MIKLNNQLRALVGSQSEPRYKIENSPLFITGCMRSGTTLLVDKLSWHPQLLKIGTELNDIWTDYGEVPIRGRCVGLNESDVNLESLRKMTIYISKYIQEAKSIKRHLIRLADKKRTTKGRVFYDWDNIIPVNKSPHLINKISFLEKMFPESKFLIIIRNPFAHAASTKVFIKEQFLKREVKYYVPDNENDCWHYHKNPPKSALMYPGAFKCIPLMWKRLNLSAINAAIKHPDKTLLISYEALVSSPESEFERIFDFLDLNTKHFKAESKIKLKNYEFYNTNTAGSPFSKWKKTLSEEEIEDVAIQEKLFVDELNMLKGSNKLIDDANLIESIQLLN